MEVNTAHFTPNPPITNKNIALLRKITTPRDHTFQMIVSQCAECDTRWWPFLLFKLVTRVLHQTPSNLRFSLHKRKTLLLNLSPQETIQVWGPLQLLRKIIRCFWGHQLRREICSRRWGPIQLLYIQRSFDQERCKICWSAQSNP